MRKGYRSKWVFFCARLTAITFLLVLILVQSFGTLIVVRHPRPGQKETWQLSCISEDDNGAIIWNYNPRENEHVNELDNFSNFKPNRPKPENVSECSVWKSNYCIAHWENSSTWTSVESANKSMAPVFDYRWEGFKEFVFDKRRMKEEYLYVRMVNKSSGIAVFSTRGLHNVHVFLCTAKKPMHGRCIWIILGGWNGTRSAIKSCVRGSFPREEFVNDERCMFVTEITHENNSVIDPYEWRTFRLTWDREQKTIKVFKDYDHSPLLKGNISTWHNVPHMLVRGEIPSRIRFHFYEYFWTDQENAKLSTKKIKLHDKKFCVNLLVALCPECELRISMVDENDDMIDTWKFFSNENSEHALLTWQSIKLKTTWPNSGNRTVRLIIETISNMGEGKGQWAIDSFHICNSSGIRESTIAIPVKDHLTVKCQKLFNSNSTLVNSFTSAEMGNTTQLQRFLSRRPCGSSCVNFGSNSFICDQTGCTCDRGFEGSDCSTECRMKFRKYGYNCQEHCGNCSTDVYDVRTGYCPQGCNLFKLLPPACKLDFGPEKPTVTNITNTTAKVIQKIELEPDAHIFVGFYITELESHAPRDISPGSARRPSMYESDIENLKPNTGYKVQTIVQTIKSTNKTLNRTEISGQANSSGIIFWTTCTDEPRFKVLPGQTNLTITVPRRGKMCGDRIDLKYKIDVLDGANGELKHSHTTDLPYTCSPLIAHTKYKVSISLGGTLMFIEIVRTLESAPSEPQILKWTDRGHGVIMLKWNHPSFSQSQIKKFRIYVEFQKTKLRVEPNIKAPRLIDHPVKHDNEKYSTRLYLFPSTVYKVSVVAVSEHNFSSVESKIEISISGSVGFKSGEELQLTQSGALIKLKAPAVVNATSNTRVIIFVKELTLCAKNKSQKSSSLLNPWGWLGAEYEETESKSEYVTIDTKSDQNRASNCSPKSARTYVITAVVRDLYSNSSANRISEITLINDNGNDLTWLIILSIVTNLLLLLLILYRKWGKRLTRDNRQDIVPLSSMMMRTGISEAPHILRDNSGSLPNAGENQVSIQQSPHDVIPYNPYSYPVQVDQFEEYAKEAIASGLLSSQFALLSSGPTKERRRGKLPENLAKNRYKSVIPYDETRVILDKIPGDSHSDYINASYIKGYRKERAYIAAQSPLPNTVNDFWRMVWQEQSGVICMLTNIVENGKTECEQYWPEVGTEIMCGNILVSNNDHEVFADYTIRTLSLDYGGTKREVTLFHYTGWPDKGVPIFSQSLVAYLKKLLAKPTGKGPVIVHCSSGTDRTGTIILCSICLRQAVGERIFDVPGVTARMREDRADMLGNIQQYCLAHLVIMECMTYEQTQISCSDGLPMKIKELRKHLLSDMHSLKDTVWQDRALHSLAQTRYSISDDEESGVPATPIVAQFYRDSIFDSESNYINAVGVDGVKMKKQFLASHLPSPGTISEYWRLINEKKIELILILQTPKRNDPISCDIISSDAIFIPVPEIQVETKAAVYDEEHFTVRKFLLRDSSEKKVREQPVTVLTCTGWGRGSNGKPPIPAALVSLWIASEKISRKETPTLVLCHDGVTGCGLYLALSFLLEKMAVERECDIISAVRAVRRSRTQFVQSLEQFNYLYDAAENYFQCFQAYSNFS